MLKFFNYQANRFLMLPQELLTKNITMKTLIIKLNLSKNYNLQRHIFLYLFFYQF